MRVVVALCSIELMELALFDSRWRIFCITWRLSQCDCGQFLCQRGKDVDITKQQQARWLAAADDCSDNLSLEAIAKVLTELVEKLGWPVAGWLKSTHEEAQYWGLVGEAKTTDEIAILVEPGEAVDSVLNL